jgi:hypothetical protein
MEEAMQAMEAILMATLLILLLPLFKVVWLVIPTELLFQDWPHLSPLPLLNISMPSSELMLPMAMVMVLDIITVDGNNYHQCIWWTEGNFCWIEINQSNNNHHRFVIYYF